MAHCFVDSKKTNFDRILAAKKKFTTKYAGKKSLNVFSTGFFDALSAIAWPAHLPKNFEGHLESYILKAMATEGYDANNVRASVQKSIEPFVRTYQFRAVDNELDKRRELSMYVIRPSVPCRPVYSSFTLGNPSLNKMDIVDNMRSGELSAVFRKRILSKANERQIDANFVKDAVVKRVEQPFK